jgi:hypothetical protein
MTCHVLFCTSHARLLRRSGELVATGEHLWFRVDVTLIFILQRPFSPSNWTSCTLEHWNRGCEFRSGRACLHFSVFLFTCAGRGLATSRSLAQGVLKMFLIKIPKPGKAGAFGPHWSVLPWKKKTARTILWMVFWRFITHRRSISRISRRNTSSRSQVKTLRCFRWGALYRTHFIVFTLNRLCSQGLYPYKLPKSKLCSQFHLCVVTSEKWSLCYKQNWWCHVIHFYHTIFKIANATDSEISRATACRCCAAGWAVGWGGGEARRCTCAEKLSFPWNGIFLLP